MNYESTSITIKNKVTTLKKYHKNFKKAKPEDSNRKRSVAIPNILHSSDDLA